MLKVHQFYSLKLKCFTAQGWKKVQVYIQPHENIEEGTGIINLFNTEKSLQTRTGSAVHFSKKNKYEQPENDQKNVTGIMSGKLPQLSRGHQEGQKQLVKGGKVF